MEMPFWMWDIYMISLHSKECVSDLSVSRPDLHNTKDSHKTIVVFRDEMEGGIPVQEFVNKLKNEV